MSGETYEQTELMVCPPTCRIPAVSSVQRLCSDCGQPVWVSLTMRPVVDAGEVKPWCDDCCAREPDRPILVQHPLQAVAGMSITDFDEMSTRILDRVRGGVR